ncbi:DUF5381 family protein [Aneurinibacillus tyrosinisolvens]|uniref:DUF5381 family protein n=1 Tax=Aneurinibacillus tyrosinisolvens TaxID=1443435 RepID=UPI00063F3C73|nr:DUF5381 family protein [Aneurinibacillus tyrosinisolvens]
MHHVTYSRKTMIIKVLVMLLFVITVFWILFSGFAVEESSFAKGLIYAAMSLILVFFLVAFGMFAYYLCKPNKIVLLSFDKTGFYYGDHFIPHDKVKWFGYGLNRKDFRTAFFEGFTIKTNKEEIIIPTYQLLLNKEINKWVFSPLEKYAPQLFEGDGEEWQ